MELAGPYRGMAPVPLWGASRRARIAGHRRPCRLATGRRLRPEPDAAASPEGPRPRTRAKTTRSPAPGWCGPTIPQEKAEDPAGLQRPADRDQQADPGELADALSELPELRLVRSPEPVHEVLVGEDPIRPMPLASASAPQASGIAYPEWDWRAGAYRPRGAIVRERAAEEGERAWVEARFTATRR